MALINGNDYDHIDFTKNGVTTRHMLKDTLSRQMSGDLVKVQNEEPTSEGTKIWIKPSGDSEVQVPTYEEFEELSDKIDDADATIESLAVGAQPTVSVTEVDSHKRFSFGIPASNGIVSITKTATDGVIDTYTIAMTDGTSTSFSVNNSDITPESMAEAIATALQDYARIDGYYPDLTAGNADQLNSTKFVENKEPYLYRPSGGTSDIGNRKYLDAIVGVSLPWNQMVRDEASENQTDFADILTVTDAVEDSAALKVKIEPQQDLHGYDHPWPAGGGKNIFPNIGVEATVKSGVSISYDSNENVYILNGTMTSIGDFELAQIPSDQLHLNTAMETGTRILSVRVVSGNFTLGGDSGITYAVAIFNAAKNDFMRGDTNGAESKLDGYYCRRASAFSETSSYSLLFQCWREGTVFNNLKIRVQLEEAASTSATPSAWTPYSNICPISGFDGLTVTRAGKNLLNAAELAMESSGYNRYFPLKLKKGTYTMSCQNRLAIGGTGSSCRVSIVNSTKNQIKAISPNYGYSNAYKSFSFTITDSEADQMAYLVFEPVVSGTTFSDIEPMQNMVELGSTATAYEPYQGETYDITFPTEAGTVYGGELTINDDGSGGLVVDKVEYTIDGVNTVGRIRGVYCNINPYHELLGVNPTQATWKCNTYVCNTSSCGYNSTYEFLFLVESAWGKVAENETEFNAYCQQNPIQFVIPLITPVTYTLTASQIRTLLGTNNVWADTGDLALTYTGTDEHLVLESGKKYLSRISGTDSMLLGSGQEITAAKGTDNVFDLTQMFGTAVADYVYGQGAGFFRQWFPNARYPYNAGELLSVEGLQSHDMVGFNQWDEQYELQGNGTRIVSKNLIPVLPNTEYAWTAPVQPANGLRFYDSNQTLISTIYSTRNNKFTTPENCYYIWFALASSYGTTYNHDICISLAHNGSRNGEYAPYEKHSYPLDSSVILRGIPKVGASGVYWDGDRYLPDGTVERRYGVVDLGTLTWERITTQVEGKYRFKTSINGISHNTSNAVCTKYQKVNSTNTATDTGWACAAQNYFIYDESFSGSSYTEFKAAISGVYLVYELKEPTIEQALPYRNFQLVDDWGTEEFVTTGMIPVGQESRYPANLRDKLQHLPDAASSNGSYLITQTDGQMTLTPFPAPPTTAGKYALRATVTNGVATFAWEATT